jgi:hypothetical protein
MRAQQLHLLSENAAQHRWKYRTTRRWHRREPLDSPSVTPVGEPRLLRRAIEVRSKKELVVSDIGLGAEDLEMMAVLPIGNFIGSAEIVAIEPKLKESESVPRSGKIVPFPRGT